MISGQVPTLMRDHFDRSSSVHGKMGPKSVTYSSWCDIHRGLIPRLIGELLTIWLVNVLTHIVNTHVVTVDQQHSQVIY